MKIFRFNNIPKPLNVKAPDTQNVGVRRVMVDVTIILMIEIIVSIIIKM